MIAKHLKPNIDLLCEEYVLVQAWKKTASYIRYHNWYADTLELDRATVNLPRFLGELAEQLKAFDQWNNEPLRIVPAPKSQPWRVHPETNRWEPLKRGKVASKLRPLAHVSLKDQVAATAVMLCLADRVETLQGDPRDSIGDAEKRKGVISYGNRLFCDAGGKSLRHRWGSAKLYRAYFQDYRSFLARSELAAKSVDSTDGARVTVVHSDLRQFYDRVRPELLADKLSAMRREEDDPAFFELTSRLFDWKWNRQDASYVARFAKQAGLSDFTRIALPQGLVAAGFFANATLLDFDDALRAAISTEIAPGVRVEDVCRYVDDLRVVLTADRQTSLEDVEDVVRLWLQELLDQTARGLEVSEQKTRAAAFIGDERPLVRQSRTMERIQGAISGGFDAVGGEEILDAVQGLIRSQERYSKERNEENAWSFAPIPDVRDETVARFGAARFRSTYRSLRPLLANSEEEATASKESEDESIEDRPHRARTQTDLDNEARAFALGLIESWVEDPSNVRLLRIGLDLWPADDVLKGILDLLRPFTEEDRRLQVHPRRVAWYCLAEIFRAGATETGFVEDSESLPDEIDIDAYRSVLRREAIRLVAEPAASVPWYVRQQAFLYLATCGLAKIPTIYACHNAETLHYGELLHFLAGEGDDLSDEDFVTLAILARRSFSGEDPALRLVGDDVTPSRFAQIADRDPSFAIEILVSKSALADGVSPQLSDDLCLQIRDQSNGYVSLAQTVLQGGPISALRNELTLLSFASKFLAALGANRSGEAITPANVWLKLPNEEGVIFEVEEVRIESSKTSSELSMYGPPSWCSAIQRWRFQLGYLLRFILTAKQDFTKVVRRRSWKEETATYRAPESHRYQRLYGLFNAHSSFGDDWLPISDWIEQLLSSLLKWPGCRSSKFDDDVDDGLETTMRLIDLRHGELLGRQENQTQILLMPRITSSPLKKAVRRPLRACVMQLVIPADEDYDLKDLELDDPVIRKRHRNHLSAALAAIVRMLDLRETHKGRDGRLDWLILPELSVHPMDVKTHLLPFARAYKTIILAGLAYQKLVPGQPLVNTAAWVIPEWSKAYGLQTRVLLQGKQHLAAAEQTFNKKTKVLHGFRPCQWLIGYDWSPNMQPCWLTASICYDATDLSLATLLRDNSDIFAIPSLNRDVTTFDQMAQALHYHMFQMVIVVNNGKYGGSNAYRPLREAHLRQVFHLHGQPQASVAFLEIDDVGEYLKRKSDARNSPSQQKKPPPSNKWKFPPAGL